MVKPSRMRAVNEITAASTRELLSQDLAKQVRTAYTGIEERGMSACLFGSQRHLLQELQHGAVPDH